MAFNKVFAEETKKVALNPNEFTEFSLREIRPITHNVNLFRFALPEQDQVSGMFVASCIVVKAKLGEKDVIRPYTPVSTPDTVGHFDLMIKRYEQGNMSKHIHSLKVGDKLLVKGPIAKYPYKANMKKRIAMIAGGTGITPMYQVIRNVLGNPEDKTEVYLLYGNVTPDDIMLKQELEGLATKHKNFHVTFTVDKADASWKKETGYITEQTVKKAFPGLDPQDEENVVFVCGPPPMMRALSGEKKSPSEQGELTGLLKNMGFSEKTVFKF